MNNEFPEMPIAIDITNSRDIRFGTVSINGRAHGFKVANSEGVSAQYYNHTIDAIGDLHQALRALGLSRDQAAALLRAVVLSGTATDAAAVETAMKSHNLDRVLSNGESVTTIANNAATFFSSDIGQQTLMYGRSLWVGAKSYFTS